MTPREKWNALSDVARDELLEAYRDSLEYNWYEDTYEMFTQEMKEIGVEVSKIYFSGFCCQGDGACFEGSVQDWNKFLPAAGKPELAAQLPAYRDQSIRLSWTHSGRYYHENCVDFSLDGLLVGNPYDEGEDPVRYVTWGHTQPEGGPFHGASDELIEFLKSRMRELYRWLEADHDYLTSDECTTEYILTNYMGEVEERLEQEREENFAAAQLSFIF